MDIVKMDIANIQGSDCQIFKRVHERRSNRMPHTLGGSLRLLGGAGLTGELIDDMEQELIQYLEIFHPCFHPEQVKYVTAYIKGLMSDLEYKSAEPIALRYGLSVRGTQRFLNTGKWPDQQMWDIYRRRLAEPIACEGGMLTVDRHETPKKGKHSVGVAHQYCGAMGKVANCQSGAYIGYSSKHGHGVIDCGLYLPEIWFDEGHKKLREKCGVPEGTAFRTKASMAAEMLQKAHSSGLFPAGWVGLDSFFGSNKEFLLALPKDMWYFADTPPDTLVFHEMPTLVAPAYSGRGRRRLKAVPSIAPIAVKDIASVASGANANAAAAAANAKWAQIHIGEGQEGPIRFYEKCVRVIRGESGALGEEVWLYIWKLGDGALKFSFCNAPLDAPVSMIRSAALMRHPIGQCFDECKRYLGLDQYEGRSWNIWHRHNLLVFVTHLFLTCLRNKPKSSHPAIDKDTGTTVAKLYVPR